MGARSMSEPRRRYSSDGAAFEQQKLHAAYKAYHIARRVRMVEGEKDRLHASIAAGRKHVGVGNAAVELARLRQLQKQDAKQRPWTAPHNNTARPRTQQRCNICSLQLGTCNHTRHPQPQPCSTWLSRLVISTVL